MNKDDLASLDQPLLESEEEEELEPDQELLEQELKKSLADWQDRVYKPCPWQDTNERHREAQIELHEDLLRGKKRYGAWTPRQVKLVQRLVENYKQRG